jgi:hypothetical protein
MWVTVRDRHSNVITPKLDLLAVHFKGVLARLVQPQFDPKDDELARAVDVAMSLDWVGAAA